MWYAPVKPDRRVAQQVGAAASFLHILLAVNNPEKNAAARGQQGILFQSGSQENYTGCQFFHYIYVHTLGSKMFDNPA